VGNETKTLLRKDLVNYHLPLYRASGAGKAVDGGGGGKP